MSDKFIQAVQSLGRDFDKQLKSASNTLSFEALATKALETFDADAHHNIDNLIAFSDSPEGIANFDFKRKGEPYWDNFGFSDKGVTLFIGDDYYIDAYLWGIGNPPVTHSHSFGGAFRQIKGRSDHVEYKWNNEAEYLNSSLWHGDLTMHMHEILTPGQTRTVFPGPDFIHVTMHLDRPTATLCLRTKPLKDFKMRSYLPPRWRINLSYPANLSLIKTLNTQISQMSDDEIGAWLNKHWSEGVLLTVYTMDFYKRITDLEQRQRLKNVLELILGEYPWFKDFNNDLGLQKNVWKKIDAIRAIS